MIPLTADAEIPFEASFDASFPHDDVSAIEIIRQGWAISLNAAFCVLHEICQPPHPRAVSRERLRELVSEWSVGADHPLKAPVLQAANALIDEEPLDWRRGVELMKQVGSYDGQRAALAIVYFASDCDSFEGDKALTEIDTIIRVHWDAIGI